MRALLLAVALTAPLHADAMDDYVRDQMARLHLPGVAVAVVRNGEPSAIRTYGNASLELGVPVTRDTVFELGSLTKQFTAFALMTLVEEGKIRLDESIAAYLPDVPEQWRAIKVRHLLTHTSGIREYLSIPDLAEDVHGARTHEEITRMFFARLPLEFAPGETWAYSNSGYLLLGHILERVSGKSYWDLLRERIFAPLGMRSTRSSAPDAVIAHRAAGYGWSGNGYTNRGALTENAFAAGSVVSTIVDMVRWEKALHRREILTKKSYEAMWTPVRGLPFSYGFGWVVDTREGSRVVTHSGGTPGFSSTIHRFVDRGLTVIVLANHGDRIIDQLAIHIAGLAGRAAVDPDPPLTEKLTNALRGFMSGKPDPQLFTPAMRLFLVTASGTGMGEWIGSHGELKSLTWTGRDAETRRYIGMVGDVELRFSFTLTDSGEIAQIYWW